MQAPVPSAPSPNAILMTAAAAVSVDRAAELVADRWGIRGSAKVLPGERDQNFLIQDDRGRKFLLKIANPAEDRSVTDLQVAVLLHLQRVDTTLPVQRVFPSSAGRAVEYAALGDGAERAIRVVTFLDGSMLHQAQRSADLPGNLGRMLARIGKALATFNHPAAMQPLSWDIQRADSLLSFVPSVKDTQLREALSAIFTRFRSDVEPRMSTFRRQVVHNDFSADNVLVSATHPAEITGVLDFGDMIHTPLVNDVAVAAAYLLNDSNDMFDNAAQLIGAYHEVTPLRTEELALLFDLVLTRMAMRIAITEWRAQEFPENREYILRNTPSTRAQLDKLLSLDASAARRALTKLCQPE